MLFVTKKLSKQEIILVAGDTVSLLKPIVKVVNNQFLLTLILN